MSLPVFPKESPMCLNDSLSMIISSIAMEELSLSHIINAESEKLRYILGKLENTGDKASVEAALAANKSVNCLLNSVMNTQIILKSKLDSAICALEECQVPGPAGPAGPPGPPGEPGTRRGACFSGCVAQCWNAGKPLLWSRPECSKCCSIRLSSDCEHIIIECPGCYAVGFSMELCASERRCKSVEISVSTNDCVKTREWFVSHTPIIYEGVPVTVSAAGICVPVKSCTNELFLTLRSPSAVKVGRSSICVMEI